MFHKFCAAYQAVEEKIDVLSLQYRVLLFAAIWVVIFIVWYLLGVTTMQGYRENLLLTRASATKQLTIVEQRIVAIKRATKNNENKNQEEENLSSQARSVCDIFFKSPTTQLMKCTCFPSCQHFCPQIMLPSPPHQLTKSSRAAQS